MKTTTETRPTIKEVRPINFIFFRAETYVHELVKFIPVAKDLYREAVNYNLHVSGPIHWHYFGFDGDVSKPFILEIALPVAEVVSGYDGNFHFKRTEPFKCVSLMHEGGWMTIPDAYGKLMQFIAGENLRPAGVNREIYVNVDFNDADANVTEVQLGVL